MESFTYDNIYKMAEKRYPCPNNLLSSVAVTKAKIDAFIEGFQEAVNYHRKTDNNDSNNESEFNYKSSDISWDIHCHETH